MPSLSRCRKSANLSRIARSVYGSERVRPYPAPLLPTFPPTPPPDPRRPQRKEGKRRGY
ncbi:MAG: hypothetical protein H0U76_10040 [Ktedonobacteraceae bacterium]|nr:hypothetical protein [Ktedonobacteraceae bacterium]